MLINLLHRRPRVGDPLHEGAGPGVDAGDAVAALPGPVANDAQQVPSVPGVADEEAAPGVPAARVFAKLRPGAHLGAVHREALLTGLQANLRNLRHLTSDKNPAIIMETDLELELII